MADPITIAAGASMGASALGGIVGGLGAEQAGAANAAAYRYKAGVALLNQKIAKQNAAWALQSGGIIAMEKGLQAGQEIAQTKVNQSGSNLDVNFGSNKAVRDTQAGISQFDQDVIRWDAAKQAYGYETKGVMDVAEAQLDTMSADQAKKAGDISMFSSFVNAGGSVASKWMQGKEAGAWA